MDPEKALEDLENGKPVLVHDSESRENEIDMFIRASKVTPELVRLMRKDGGGLICVAIHPKIAEAIGLPFIHDLYLKSDDDLLKKLAEKEIPYDKRSSFSITVNHVETNTGITDIDRSKTIREIGELCRKYWFGELNDTMIRSKFIEEFRSPGHVHLLKGANNLLEERKGHTELAIALSLLAGIEPCVTLVEMLGNNGRALEFKRAEKYAEEHGLQILTGKQITELFHQKLVKKLG
ncbi:MAG: 3,4-dihydroxy-2-butanone-4-phosphate synthase [Candidatus Njordarchaeia archaeon]